MTKDLVRRHSGARGAERFVLEVLADLASPEHLAWPSNRLLVERTGYSERQVQRALYRLRHSGEILHQRSGDRRRVFLISPGAPHQQPLFGSVPDLSVTLGRHVGRQLRTQATTDTSGRGDTYARAASNPQERINSTPPSPPKGGSAVAEDLDRQDQTPRVTARLERAAARRRRRRRGQAPPAPVGESCPLNDALADSAARDQLREVWLALSEPLRAQIGDPTFEIWFGGSHLHAAEHRVELAVRPAMLSWIYGRYAGVLQRIAERPLELVGCAALAEARR